MGQCDGCRDGEIFELPITMAFQPIVDVVNRQLFAHEALVRGADGQGAAFVMSQVSASGMYAFDQICRTTAIDLATKLGLADQGALLSINFLPNAVYEPRACIRQTLAAARRASFPLQNILFEFTETERVDPAHLLNILNTYRAMGFKTAIDDFGSGYSGLALLAGFQPDYIKMDMTLIRDIDSDPTRQAIVRNSLGMMRELDIGVICEGIETLGEYRCLRDLGVRLMQGYFIARPALASLAEPHWPPD